MRGCGRNRSRRMTPMTALKAYNLRIEDVDGHMPSAVRWELVEGELRIMAPGGAEHGGIAMTMGILLGQHVRARRIGRVYAAETGFVLGRGPDTLRAPDVAFVTTARMREVPRGFFPGAPDLAVEVVSPGDTIPEVEEKTEWWLKAGAREVWIVWPKTRSVTIHGRSEYVIPLGPNDELTGDPLVPDFRCRVSEIFE